MCVGQETVSGLRAVVHIQYWVPVGHIAVASGLVRCWDASKGVQECDKIVCDDKVAGVLKLAPSHKLNSDAIAEKKSNIWPLPQCHPFDSIIS